MRYVVDCREQPSENNCTLTIAGERGEVLKGRETAEFLFGRRNLPWAGRQRVGGIAATPRHRGGHC
jgi:hypothetical protein